MVYVAVVIILDYSLI